MDNDALMLQVTAARTLTPHIRELELRSRDGAPLPRFDAGAHLRFTLPGPQGAIERCYSLINATEQTGFYRIAVQRAQASAGGSAYMCEEVRVGTVLRACAPKNDFALAADATQHLLLAGGIGITPIIAMAQVLADAGQSFELHYVARTPENMAYAQWLHTAYDDRAHLYFDGGDPSQGMPLGTLLAQPHPGVHVYVCGPQPMIDAVLATGEALGWPRSQLHFELFSAPAVKADDAPFEVELARSHRRLQVGQSTSILDTLIAAGLDPLFDCRRGECGACAVPVLDGVPEHLDYALTPEQKAGNKTMCICVSRARSARLVLDI
ncbi:vanillate O-demethylase ferredoxin subunit [Variovorax sp. 54]|uniref:PDR/VanB family oxidoreductase n=1 Tax=Variovorax sp. 54 TaxID=2035212 RepID=UPI000C18A526|nr:PDR/VanB family oxidoreductase [Variovorax sp. 54]PIF77801.1 vanillate O-demethylase ferredoxin subunit [Variovorax sp. 54]